MNRLDTSNKSWLSYFIVTLLIIQSNFPFFVGNIYLVFFTCITLIIFLARQISINFFFFSYLLFFTSLMGIHILINGKFNGGPFFGILLRFTFAYLAIKVIGKGFLKCFVNFIYFFSIIGLFFWVLLAFIPNAYSIASEISDAIRPIELWGHVRNNLIIYTNDYWLLDKFPRNAGPFWEPGGYGVFLVISILFNTMLTQKLFHSRNIIFLFSAITTFSLGTYVAILIFFFSYAFFVNKNKNKINVAIILLCFVYFIYSWNKYEFLSEKFEARESKVENNLDESTTYANINYNPGRNEELRLDLRAFKENPIFGEGQFLDYEYGSSSIGITDFLKKWGIIGFGFFFTVIFFSFKRYSLFNNLPRGFALVSVITILAVGLAQGIYQKPIFMSFSFLFLVFNKYVTPRNLSNEKGS